MTDGLRDALAEAQEDDVPGTAEAWPNTGNCGRQPGWEQVTVDDHVKFLRQLRDLSRSARDRGRHLFCYFEA